MKILKNRLYAKYNFLFWGQIWPEHVLYRSCKIVPVGLKSMYWDRLAFVLVYCCQMFSVCVCLRPADGGAGAVCDSDGHAHRCSADILVLQREAWPQAVTPLCSQSSSLCRLSSSILRRLTNNNRIKELKKEEAVATAKLSSLMMQFLKSSRGNWSREAI